MCVCWCERCGRGGGRSGSYGCGGVTAVRGERIASMWIREQALEQALEQGTLRSLLSVVDTTHNGNHD